MSVDVGRPTDYGWHHPLPGILGYINGGKDLSSIVHFYSLVVFLIVNGINSYNLDFPKVTVSLNCEPE